MMLRNLAVLAILPATFLNAAGGPTAIGTASTRGDIRVDHLSVRGNATLFDGSVVETGLTSADLRLSKGIQLSLSMNSRGVLFRDHIVLQSGTGEFRSTGGFIVEADGLRVTANEGTSTAVVSLKPNNTVEVNVLSGSYGVTSDQGAALGRVLAGHPLSFSMQSNATPAASQSFKGTGLFSKDAKGFYYLTANGVKYQITGPNLDRFVGKKVTIIGNTVADQVPEGGAVLVVAVTSAKVGGGVLTSGTVIGGVLVGTGIGAALAVGGLAASGAFSTSTP